LTIKEDHRQQALDSIKRASSSDGQKGRNGETLKRKTFLSYQKLNGKCLLCNGKELKSLADMKKFSSVVFHWPPPPEKWIISFVLFHDA